MDLILLHGALGDSRTLDPLGESLRGNFNIHLLNFSGHGQTAFEGAFTIDRFADKLEHYIKVNGLQRPGVFGYSMGGYVALALAARQPGIVGAIFTLATKFNWTPESAQRETKYLDPTVIVQKVPAFAQQLRERHGEQWERVCRETAGMMTKLGFDPEPDFTKIDCPVTIGIGSADKMVSVEESSRVAEGIPNARLHVFQNMEHPLEKSDPEEIAEKLRKFFL